MHLARHKAFLGVKNESRLAWEQNQLYSAWVVNVLDIPLSCIIQCLRVLTLEGGWFFFLFAFSEFFEKIKKSAAQVWEK